MIVDELTKNIKFDEKGLVPAIVQDYHSSEVLMMAYMNEESIEKTLTSGFAHYYSRSRKKLWKKGETSGNTQEVKGLYYDCDGDTILVKVIQKGPACHTGEYSCFHNPIIENRKEIDTDTDTDKSIFDKLYKTIQDRKKIPIEGSYTNYLFEKGIDKILKKVGEESSEVIIAAKNNDNKELTYEISDMVYHVMVLMINQGLTIEDIKEELRSRYK